MTADPALAVDAVAAAISEAFAAYHGTFQAITHRARLRFEQRDWHGLHADAETRLDLYNDYVHRAVAALHAQLGAPGPDRAFWAAAKTCFTTYVAARDDYELAESFYNSVIMRLVATPGLDPDLAYTGSEFAARRPVADEAIYAAYLPTAGTPALIRELLAAYEWAVPYADPERDAALAAAVITAYLQDSPGDDQIEDIEIARPVFYRGTGAYLLGRIRTGSRYVPLLLALANGPSGITVDAVLLTQDEVSIVFSFARSYFHVEVAQPQALVHFLKTILPLKPVPELYIALGYNKHGKTELYRAFQRHLGRSSDQFERARGARGMVMIVFTLPSYDVVFKIIKDQFDPPKTTTRRDVLRRYQLVFKHDRGGRLVDAQEFEHLRFAKERFAPDLLDELLRVAGHTVRVEDDAVVIDHLYTERRLTPLNLYLHEEDGERAAAAVQDYGQTIKDLAATNIYPGDILLKNFGVTRHGRVVFYDYDELCLLTECTFRELPEDDGLGGEPSFFVGEDDVFPEELHTFLGLPPDLRDLFIQLHGDLFDVAFWTDLQARQRAGEFIDILPYPENKRLEVVSRQPAAVVAQEQAG